MKLNLEIVINDEGHPTAITSSAPCCHGAGKTTSKVSAISSSG